MFRRRGDVLARRIPFLGSLAAAVVSLVLLVFRRVSSTTYLGDGVIALEFRR